MSRVIMNVKIEHKVHHSEWDEAHLTPEQFIKFNALYNGKNRSGIYQTFVFDNGSVYVGESWDIDDCGRVSTSSYSSGVMGFSEESGQYIESFHYSKKELGQLTSIYFTVDDDVSEVFNLLK